MAVVGFAGSYVIDEKLLFVKSGLCYGFREKNQICWTEESEYCAEKGNTEGVEKAATDAHVCLDGFSVFAVVFDYSDGGNHYRI